MLREWSGELVDEKNKLPNSRGFCRRGLISTIDVVLDSTMKSTVPSMSLSPDISAALLNRQGIIGETLTAITEYEARRPPASATDISDAYIEACQWTDQVLGTFGA